MRKSRPMRGARWALVVVGAVFGAALLTAGMASAADQVELRSRLAGNWCFDAPNGNNTATVLNPCNGSKSQLWVFNPAGQFESVAFPGQCIDINNAADDTPVTLAPCQTNTNNEHWTHQANGQVTSALGPCLHASGVSGGGGAARYGIPVSAHQCLDNVADEQWDIVP
jgi:Ricin-type beta-trefoil lectin domain